MIQQSVREERAGSPDQEQDFAWLRLAAGGDQIAFARLFDQSAPAVLGLLHRILGSRGIAEEVLQEVFLQAWRQADHYRPESASVRGWLCMIARSRGLDRLRHERAAVQRDSVYGETREYLLPLGTLRLEERERRRILGQALAQLSDDQRACIELVMSEGLSHAEIAARLATPLGTVKSRIRTGMARMREALTPAAAIAATLA